MKWNNEMPFCVFIPPFSVYLGRSGQPGRQTFWQNLLLLDNALYKSHVQLPHLMLNRTHTRYDGGDVTSRLIAKEVRSAGYSNTDNSESTRRVRVRVICMGLKQNRVLIKEMSILHSTSTLRPFLARIVHLMIQA